MTFPPVDAGAWRARVEEELAGADFARALVTRTLEGLPVAPLFGPEDGPSAARGQPGAAPFVRGGRPADGGAWRIAAHVDAPDPDRAGAEAAADAAAGADALLVRLDRCGRLGRPHSAADGAPGADDVGVGGIAISDARDLGRVLQDVDLTAVPVALDPGANGIPAAALLLTVLRERGIDPALFHGHLGCDVHAALARDGALPGDVDDARRELVRLAVHSRMHFEHVRSLAVDAGPWHRAGGHVVQELGLALAAFVEQLRWLGPELPPAAAAGEVVFRIDVGRDLVTEIAKLRALRMLYAKVMTAAGVPVPPAPVIHATTSTRGMSARDPHTNMLRATVGAFAAAAGGADWITVLPFDHALGERSTTARRSAVTTQLVLAHECHLGHVSDPAGGAYAVEAWTVELARAGWALMQELERHGGLAAALEDGHVAALLAEPRAALAHEVATRRWPVTGVSEYPLANERRDPARDPALEERRAARARAATAEEQRGRERGRMVLGDVDTVEHAAEAAARGATLAELGGALVRGAPLFREALPDLREAAPFEALRDAADAAPAPPRAFLACLGSLPEHGPRAQFAANLLRAGGLDVTQGPGTSGAAPVAELAHQVAGAGPLAVVCVCGSDGAYSAHAIAAVTALHEERPEFIVYAGRPRDTGFEVELRDAGVGAFAFPGCDALAVLQGIPALAHAARGGATRGEVTA